MGGMADLAQALEVVSRRVLAWPREVVFAAFVDPARLARWWGPAGFTNEFEVFEPRTGGAWRFVMRGPDGKTFQNEKVFLEFAAPERIVVRHLGSMHRFVMTMTCAATGPERTELTWRMVFEPSVQNANLRGFIERANEENFDRLEAELRRGALGS